MRRLSSLLSMQRGIRWSLALLISVCTLLSSYALVQYIDEQCASPAMSIIVIILWLTWLMIASISVSSLISSELIYEGFINKYIDDSYDFIDQDDTTWSKRVTVNGFQRFTIILTIIFSFFLLSTHVGYNQFLTRYQKSGVTLIYLRSEDPLIRLRGLNRLVDIGSFSINLQREHSPALTNQLRILLNDPHEGVRARAMFISGVVNDLQAIPPLQKAVLNDESLRETALLALGEIHTTGVEENPAHTVLYALLKEPHIIKSEPFALIVAFGAQSLNAHGVLQKLYDVYSGDDRESTKLREAIVWSIGQTRDAKQLLFFQKALKDSSLRVRCLAANSLEKMVIFESSPILQDAFLASHKDDHCPQIDGPTQTGIKPRIWLPRRSYQLTIARALATTDDPDLLIWIVEHQEGINPMAHRLFYKYYKALEKKDQKGLLEHFKRRNARRRRN